MAEPRLILSKKAEDDIDAIAGFIAQRDGIARAAAVTERIWKTMRNLAFMPGMGNRRPYLEPGALAFPVAPWTIYYKSLPDGIRILRILDGRRNAAAIFGKKS